MASESESWQLLALALPLTLPPSMATEEPFILLFRSTFCSLCMINQGYFAEEETTYPDIPIKIIDIAHTEFKVLNLKLFSIPTVIIVKNKKVFYFKEGVLTRLEVQNLLELASKLKKL